MGRGGGGGKSQDHQVEAEMDGFGKHPYFRDEMETGSIYLCMCVLAPPDCVPHSTGMTTKTSDVVHGRDIVVLYLLSAADLV